MGRDDSTRNINTQNIKSNNFFDCVEVTNDTLTGRGGLSLFVRYLRNSGLLPHLESEFGNIRKSRKGQAVTQIFKKPFCFFINEAVKYAQIVYPGATHSSFTSNMKKMLYYCGKYVILIEQ